MTDIERAEQYSINGKEEKEKPQTQEPNYEKKQCSLRAWAKDLSWDWVAPPIQASHLVEEHHLPSSEVPLHARSIWDKWVIQFKYDVIHLKREL